MRVRLCYFLNMIHVLTKEDALYPKLLKQAPRAPSKLFYKGTLDTPLFESCLGVVGSRRMTSYGKQAVKELVGTVAAAGITIVSGFMYGIDATAHKVCIDSGGRTIAVMPCGIDYIHPENQTELYASILNHSGLVLSEYEGTLKPQMWMYPSRNRIVAGLCQAILVVEASVNSGSLITASFAKRFSRQIFVVPGSIFSENSLGVYQLFEEGAKLVISPSDILDFYQFSRLPQRRNFTQLALGVTEENGLEGEILSYLRREPMSLDELSRVMKMGFGKLSSLLTVLCLEEKVLEDNGKYYVN